LRLAELVVTAFSGYHTGSSTHWMAAAAALPPFGSGFSQLTVAWVPGGFHLTTHSPPGEPSI
jgi:hypothetical protein